MESKYIHVYTVEGEGRGRGREREREGEGGREGGERGRGKEREREGERRERESVLLGWLQCLTQTHQERGLETGSEVVLR